MFSPSRASSKIEVLIRTACLLCEGCFKAISWLKPFLDGLIAELILHIPYISEIYLETTGRNFPYQKNAVSITRFDNSNFRKGRFRTTKTKMKP